MSVWWTQCINFNVIECIWCMPLLCELYIVMPCSAYKSPANGRQLEATCVTRLLSPRIIIIRRNVVYWYMFSTELHASCFVLFSAVLDPRVGHTMVVLFSFISVLCHFDWLFHRESCPHLDVVHPGRAWSSSPSCTWHCSLHYLLLQATPLFPHGVIRLSKLFHAVMCTIYLLTYLLT